MTDTQGDGLSQDTLFSLLNNPRRRFILQYLNGMDGSIQLQDLAAEVAAWENETEPENLTSKQQKRLYVSLYQTHIPKLEEADIVEYDEETGEIRLTDQGGELNRYLEGDGPDDSGRRWGWYYLVITLAGAALYGLTAVDGGPFDENVLLAIGLGWIFLGALAGFYYLETKYRS